MAVSYTKYNPILTFLTPTSRGFIDACGEAVDSEAAASWILTFGIQQMREAKERLEQKFLDDELAALRGIINKDTPCLTNLPLASALARGIKGNPMFSAQVASLSKAEIFTLVFQCLLGTFVERKTMNSDYLSPLEFARMLNPPRTKSWICHLCKSGRVPGAYKHPETGEWHIPKTALGKIAVAPRRGTRQTENKKRGKVSCPKKIEL